MSKMKNLKKAIEITEKCFSLARKTIKVGVSEKQIVKILKIKAKELGARRIAFPTIVSLSKSTKLIHPKPSNRKIKQNQFLIVDFGVVYKNARTDVTRTFCLKPDKEKKYIYNILKRSQKLALKKVKIGIKASLVDIAAREFIKKHLKYKFPYGLGHGIGGRVHKKPRINPKSKDIFKEGDIFTLEPGVHGKIGGARIEDMYILTKKGVKQLTSFPKRLEI